MTQAKVEIFIDLSKYTNVYADKLAQRVNVAVRNLAKSKVRIDSTRLRNSIRTDKLGEGHYITLAEAPYALAQEYGRPDLPQYGFTPYMRPAAILAGSSENMIKFAAEANEAAIRSSKK